MCSGSPSLFPRTSRSFTSLWILQLLRSLFLATWTSFHDVWLCFGLPLFPSSLSKTCSITDLETLFLLLHNVSDSTALTPHLAETSAMETEMAWGLRQEHRDLTALAWRTAPPFLGNAQERTPHHSKANIFQALDNLMVEFTPPSHLAWLIVICQVALGPEELPDWVIFSEKRCRDEGFRCAFSMNHTSQASGPMRGPCPLMVVGKSNTGIRGDILGAVTFPRRV